MSECYSKQLDAHPNLVGRVVIRFEVDGTGAVDNVNVTENTSGDPVLGGCAAGGVKALQFGPGAPARVSYPFKFESAGPRGPSSAQVLSILQKSIELGLKIAPLL